MDKWCDGWLCDERWDESSRRHNERDRRSSVFYSFFEARASSWTGYYSTGVSLQYNLSSVQCSVLEYSSTPVLELSVVISQCEDKLQPCLTCTWQFSSTCTWFWSTRYNVLQYFIVLEQTFKRTQAGSRRGGVFNTSTVLKSTVCYTTWYYYRIVKLRTYSWSTMCIWAVQPFEHVLEYYVVMLLR